MRTVLPDRVAAIRQGYVRPSRQCLERFEEADFLELLYEVNHVAKFVST